jgi:hypothetical protein
MSTINVGDYPIDPAVQDGTELATRLNRLYGAILSTNSSTTRPASIVAGGVWTRFTAPSTYDLMLYTGTTDKLVSTDVTGILTDIIDLQNKTANLADTTPTNVYATSDSAGLSQNTFVGEVAGGSGHTGKEGYTLFVESRPSGSGDGTVPGSDFGLGVSAVKDNWQTTTTEGQLCGLNIVVRGGYHGTNITAPWFTPGDSAAIICNTVNSAAQCFTATLESANYYMPNGAWVPGTLGMRTQINAIKQSQGIAIGYLGLGAAFQAQNVIGGAAGDGFWTDAFKYLFDPGTGVYEAFKINQAGHLILHSGGATTPKKTLRVGAGGNFEVINNAGSAVVFRVTDAGAVNVASGAVYAIDNTQVVGPRIAGWGTPTGGSRISSFNGATATLSQTSQALAQLIADLKTHGLLGS